MKTNPILMKGTKGAPIQKNMHPSALKFGPGKKKKEITYDGGLLKEVAVSAARIGGAKKTTQKMGEPNKEK